MELFFVLLFLFVVFALIGVISKNRSFSAKSYEYQKLKTLLSPAERSFFGVLSQAVERNALVFGKIRVADVLKPVKGMSRSDWQKSFNRISNKHFDFVLCDPNTLSILCAIELNDSSHESKKRKDRDAFLVNACRSAGLPLIQMPAKAGYSIPEIQKLLLNTLESK